MGERTRADKGELALKEPSWRKNKDRQMGTCVEGTIMGERRGADKRELALKEPSWEKEQGQTKGNLC